MPKIKNFNVIKSEDLIPLSEAPAKFGKGWGRSSIYERIASGELVEGKHWIDDRRSNSSKRIIKLVVPAIEELRSTPVAFR